MEGQSFAKSLCLVFHTREATTTAEIVIAKNSVAPMAHHHQKVEKAEASKRPTPNPAANTPRVPFPGDARMVS
jgi:hypothetical protein